LSYLTLGAGELFTPAYCCQFSSMHIHITPVLPKVTVNELWSHAWLWSRRQLWSPH